MHNSVLGNAVLERWLQEVRQTVERDGELTEVGVQNLVNGFGGEPNLLTTHLEQLRLSLAKNPDGLDANEHRQRNQEEALRHFSRELRLLKWQRQECEKREAADQQARSAAAQLPSPDTLEKIMRYETKLERQLYRAMFQLERLQRMRQGESAPRQWNSRYRSGHESHVALFPTNEPK